MKAKIHLVFSITILFSCFSVHGQQAYWKSVPKTSNLRSASIKETGKAKKVFSLQREAFSKSLDALHSAKGGQWVYLPDGQGEIIPFLLRETPVLHPDLAKKYPGIASYTGSSPDGRYSIKLSRSPKGLESMVVDLETQGTTFMEPAFDAPDTYVLYSAGAGDEKLEFVCKTQEALGSSAKLIVPLVDQGELRKFRIAISTTGEYTAFHGGTKAGALAAINATLTRVNGVFERDLGVSLELVANNDLVIFTDAATDPYGSGFNSQVQNTLTSLIGEAGYDVGHLFHRVSTASQNNGNAGYIGSVCVDNKKGSAFSAGSVPQGDTFDLDFVAHELGHQFGANHTWSYESEGSGVQAEPGSGSTIMGYAGIVMGNNVTQDGDDYFHFYSILQITDYLESTPCAQIVSLANQAPTVVPVGDFVIPIGTAFVLEGSASDPDPGDVLTYAWEQVDNGVVTRSSFGPENVSGANFRSLPPTTDPERYFPKLSQVALGQLTQTLPEVDSAWETVSNIERDLHFALTVRDNAAGGGQLVSDLLQVRVVKAAGPFALLSQAEPQNYVAGSQLEVIWEVAGTDASPINAYSVDIYLSLDGGLSFEIPLAEGVPNDGSQNVLLPVDATSKGRFMVKASEHIFLAVNAADFSIAPSPMVLDFEGLDFQVCQGEDLILPFTYRAVAPFSETATFSASLPPGLTATFDPPTAQADGTPVQLTLTGTAGAALGTHGLVVSATSASLSQAVDLSLDLYDGTFGPLVQSQPADGAIGVPLGTRLEWEQVPGATGYQVEIASDVGFSMLVEAVELPLNFYNPTALLEESQYFWRVRPVNACGMGSFQPPFSFTTTQVNCSSFEAKGLPMEIPSIGTSTRRIGIQFFEDLTVSDLNVKLELQHTYLADLTISLISPMGTRVALISNSCGELNNINAVFDDQGDPLECSGNPALSGTLVPLGSLSSLNGESLLGEWILEVQDSAPSDGGSLIAFSLEVCAEGAFRPDVDGDGVFDDGDDLCLGTPKGAEVDVNGCAVYRFAPDNFGLGVHSESCRSSDDGAIDIAPVNTSINYTATLVGEGVSRTGEFTGNFSFGDLSAGNYSLCINGSNGTINYREVCYELVVTQPDVLDLDALVQGGILQLELRGAEFYNVELNGLVHQTGTDNLQLKLREGVNILRVYSDLPCQGSIEKRIFHSSKPLLSPNPVPETAQLHLNGYSGRVGIAVFTVNGRLVLREERQAQGTDLQLELSTLPRGIYYLRVERNGLRESFKFIKR